MYVCRREVISNFNLSFLIDKITKHIKPRIQIIFQVCFYRMVKVLLTHINLFYNHELCCGGFAFATTEKSVFVVESLLSLSLLQIYHITSVFYIFLNNVFVHSFFVSETGKCI